jgi:hypothetical protein
MTKLDGDMCMIGFENEVDHMKGFRELFEAMRTSDEKVIDVGEKKYVIKKSLCKTLKTNHKILQENL